MLIFRKFVFRGFLLAISLAVALGLAACSGDEVAGFTSGSGGGGDCDITVAKMNSFYRGMSTDAVSNSLGCRPSKTDTSSDFVSYLWGSFTGVFAYCTFSIQPAYGTGLFLCQYSENGTNRTEKNYR